MAEVFWMLFGLSVAVSFGVFAMLDMWTWGLVSMGLWPVFWVGFRRATARALARRRWDALSAYAEKLSRNCQEEE